MITVITVRACQLYGALNAPVQFYIKQRELSVFHEKMSGSRSAPTTQRSNRVPLSTPDLHIPAELLQRAVSGAVSGVLSELGTGSGPVHRQSDDRRIHHRREGLQDGDSDFEDNITFKPNRFVANVLSRIQCIIAMYPLEYNYIYPPILVRLAYSTCHNHNNFTCDTQGF